LEVSDIKGKYNGCLTNMIYSDTISADCMLERIHKAGQKHGVFRRGTLATMNKPELQSESKRLTLHAATGYVLTGLEIAAGQVARSRGYEALAIVLDILPAPVLLSSIVDTIDRIKVGRSIRRIP
jgi:hypothetical protein